MIPREKDTMKNTDSKEYVLGYMRGYEEAWRDYQRLVSADLWNLHQKISKLDTDLGDLLEIAISRVEKIR